MMNPNKDTTIQETNMLYAHTIQQPWKYHPTISTPKIVEIQRQSCTQSIFKLGNKWTPIHIHIYTHTQRYPYIDFKSNSKFPATTVNPRCTITFTPSQKDMMLAIKHQQPHQSYYLQLTNATLTSFFTSNILMYHIHILPTKTKA
jgi:hypothetical protein